MAFPCAYTFNKIQRLWMLLPLLIIFTIITLYHVAEAENEKTFINFGGIVNLNTRIGKEQKIAMVIATEKFNSLSNTHSLIPHFRHSDRDPLVAALAAKELIKDKKVNLIVGMETWQEAALVADVGNRAQVPVISFAAPTITPPLIHHDWPFLIRVASDRAVQMKCIADIVSLYSWKRVIVIYQDDGYGGDSGMLALLSEALQDVGSKIEHHLVLPRVSSLSNPSWGELEEMLKLPTFQSRVFIVLQSSFSAATNLFRVAKKMGLVERDSAWIITESITSLLESQVNHDMEGTLGIKTYYDSNSSSYAKFEKEFQTRFPEEDNSKPGIYALRSYDIMEIIAQAIRKTTNNTTDLQVLLNTVNKHMGLSGEMHLKRGEVLNTPTFRIINIVKGNKYKELNFRGPGFGFSKSLTKEKSENRTHDVGTVVWPGNLIERAPKGWAMPTVRKPLRIVVPGRTSFSAFVKVDSRKNTLPYDGFCIQIFYKVLGLLDYPLLYEFHAVNGSYDDLVELVHNKTFDAGVGDFTVLAGRLDKVEFTQPYMESGLSMIVQEKNEQLTWMFIKPLTWQMWAASGAVLVYTILIIWFLERPSNPEFSGPLKNQIGTATWFTFTSLFFSQREKIHNNLTRVVVIMWLFVVLILTSSYTANLSSMLTIQRLKPNVTDIEMLKRTDTKVGLDGDSFVEDYLKDVLQFNSKDIITISDEFKYTEAFRNKSISAAFLELPYAKVFMNHYCKGYTATAPTYRFGGLGFIFQKGSPIAQDFTKAILQLLEDGELKSLEDTWLTPNRDCPNNATSDVPESLSVKNFMGLYVISGATSTICLLLSFTILLKKYQQHQEAYLGNASDESVWNRTVRIARFLYNREFNVPISRAPSFVDVLELTSSREEHVIISTPQEVEASNPAQTEGSPPHS
uniref:glutamate receptor 2.7-like n=1 Tax=Fragaria vesca subsp. vesca TaxID=101020 RepID=UPI0005C9C3DA|nr:PREDICTED: glutamate receptor 2.7-like [Fragaria vesca subsp. vesca]